jgi:hypothetical protein
MEEPSCETCPYWDLRDPLVETTEENRHLPLKELIRHAIHVDGKGVRGECRRYPRARVPAGEVDRGEWPRTWDFDYCGEHPKFPAWIEFMRQERTKGDPK